MLANLIELIAMASRPDETIPIPRWRIFVLNQSFVVQWEENRVQDLQTGRYYGFTPDAQPPAITDFELSELKKVGIIEDYDDILVHLPPLPSITDSPLRVYYINTTLPKQQCNLVEDALREVDLQTEFAVRTQERFVIVRAHSGHGFVSFDAAERARQMLQIALPDLMQNAVVAFVETLTTEEAL